MKSLSNKQARQNGYHPTGNRVSMTVAIKLKQSGKDIAITKRQYTPGVTMFSLWEK